MTLIPWVAEDHSPKPKGWRFFNNDVRDEKGRFVSVEDAAAGDSAFSKKIKIGEHVLLPLGIATASGVTANQLPQNQRSSKKTLKKIEDQRVNKQLVPIVKSAYPENQKFVDEIVKKVAGMDDGEAYLFSRMLMAEVMDDYIASNQRTLQRHLDEVVDQRMTTLKKVLRSSISKDSKDEALEYARAIDAWEEVIKADDDPEKKRKKRDKASYSNPYTTGAYQFDENDFRRDSSGRFTQKINVVAHPSDRLNTKQASNLGIDVEDPNYSKMTSQQKAQYQKEYMKVVNFINMAQAIGNHDIQARVMSRNGDMHWQKLSGPPKPGVDYNPRQDETIYSVEAVPKENALTLGGSLFNVIQALGGDAGTAGRINQADTTGFKSFADNWATANNKNGQGPDYKSSNDASYNRLRTGSQFLMEMSPDDSSRAAAARLGIAIGEHGAEAEKVFGPRARKTAYRYRGTERQPDPDVLRQYDAVMARAQQPEALSEADRKTLVARQNRAITNEKMSRARADRTKYGDWHSVQLSPDETRSIRGNIERAYMENMNRTVSPEASGAGRAVLADYFFARDPETGKPLRGPEKNKDLYNLQLQSGVTPPSEGFIVDKNGKVVTQAVGYGDDHYLPFNLKHLQKLRGGEYIRTRSVGGPTSEDIYTGLMTGAKKITVVSRSGIFTVKFKEDFKGKRRYNDKAFRMVNRYEQLLDTVQSEEVERNQNISPEVREYLQKEVDKEYSWADRATKREEMKNAINSYKTELQMTGADEAEFEQFFNDVSGDLPEGQKRALHAAMRNDWQSQNEFKFRLNGAGYRDAMTALQEQFPYYFDTDYQPRREMGRIETEKDKGYVEPGANRPTAAQAGYFGVHNAAASSEEKRRGKFSASEANYQRKKYATRGARTEETPSTTSTPIGGQLVGTGAGKNDAVVERVAERRSENSYVDAAKALRTAAAPTQEIIGQHNILGLSDDEFEKELHTPEGRARFEKFTAQYAAQLQGADNTKELYRKFINAATDVDLKNYTEAESLNWTSRPWKGFTGPEFKKTATRDQIRAAITKRERMHPAVSSNKLYGEMSEGEMKSELEGLKFLKMEQPSLVGLNADGLRRTLQEAALPPENTTLQLIKAGPRAIQERVNALHEVRLLKHNIERLPKEDAAPKGPTTPRSEPEPIQYGVKLQRGSRTDKENRELLKKASEELQKRLAWEAALNEDSEASAELSSAIESIDETLENPDYVPTDFVSGVAETYKKHLKRDLYDSSAD